MDLLQPTGGPKDGEMSIEMDGPAVGTTAPHVRELESSPAEYPEVSTAAVFLNQCERLAERMCLEFFVDDVRQGWTWTEAAKRVRRVAAGLMQAGIGPGERTLTETLQSIARMDGEVQEWMTQEIDGDTAVELEHRIRTITPESIASILYTSGTTGDPKGVVLTHANFVENARSGLQVFDIGPEDVTLTFMPLSHILARHSGAFACCMAGAQNVLSRGIDHLLEDIQEVRPMIMLGMPRLFDKVYAAVHDKVNAGSPVKRRLFHWADRVGRRHLREGNSASLGLRVQYALAKRLVLDSVRRKISGGRLRFFISGGAPLNPEVEEFFWMLGVQILQGWGLTETTSAATSNTEQYHLYGSAGKAMPGTELRIAADGEILVRGRGVMPEYYRDPTATAESFEDGWFKTGDVGHVDEDGFLFITDRKKDLLKTSGGKYVAPLPMETRLQSDRYIQSAVLIGDERPFVTALIVPNWANLAKDKGLVASAAELIKDSRVLAIIKEHLDLLNQELASFETIKHFSLIADDFSEARDELTPTLKLKRSIIRAHYHEMIDEMYAVATAARQSELAAKRESSSGTTA